MATISVPPGKNGNIILATKALYLEEWEMSLEIDNELYKHFEQTADANSLIFAGLNTGHVTGDATVRGKFDNTAAAYLPTSKSVWPNGTGTGWLGYTTTVGYIIGFTIIGVRAAQGAPRPAGALYEARLKITSCTFSSTGP